jgi:hypothetical protein
LARAWLAAALLAGACGTPAVSSTPDWSGKEAPGSEPRACIERFVAGERLPDVHYTRIEARLASGLVWFRVDYGQTNDCESGCFNSVGHGVLRGCDRIGWLTVDDYDGVAVDGLRWYEPEAGDALLDPATDAELARDHPSLHDDFERWKRRRARR